MAGTRTRTIASPAQRAESQDLTLTTIAIANEDTSYLVKKEKPKKTLEILDKTVSGIVKNCNLLNVRKSPSPKAEILTTLEKGAPVKVDLNGTTQNYYRILIDNVEGFCFKEFIGI